MSCYSFYCNEQMLLDNQEYYGESNKVLRNLLRRSELSTVESATAYYEKMRNRESVTYDRTHLLKYFRKGRKRDTPLLKTEQVVIYQKDIDYVTDARKKYNITQSQVSFLFGVIFFCRLYNNSKFALDTDFRMKRFQGCFKKRMLIEHFAGESWDDGYNAISGFEVLSDKYGLLIRKKSDEIGCAYVYPEFEVSENDVVAYTFIVTKENNKLNISNIVSELFDIRDHWCMMCGKYIRPLNANTGKYCKECAAQREKERLKRKNRNRKKEL